MLDIEIIEENNIKHMKPFKNCNPDISKLEKFVNACMLKSEHPYKHRVEFQELLNNMLESVYTKGLHDGERRGEQNEKREVGENWDRKRCSQRTVSRTDLECSDCHQVQTHEELGEHGSCWRCGKQFKGDLF